MKVWNYLVTSIVIILVLTFAGFETGLTDLITWVMDGTISSTGVSDVSGITTFWDIISGFLDEIAAAAGLFLVTLAITSGDKGLSFKAAVAGSALYPFARVYLYIIQQGTGAGQPAWLGMILSIIFIPLLVGYLIALIEYVGGTD